MTNSNPDKLSHLASEEIASLMQRYYAGEKNADLIADFAIDVRPNELFKLFPEIALETCCPHCDAPLWQTPRSKTATALPAPYCRACGHRVHSSPYHQCRCNNCLDQEARAKRIAMEAKRASVLDAYPLPDEWFDPDGDVLIERMTFIDAVYLLTFVRNATINEDGIAGPPYAPEKPISPTTDLTVKVIDHLWSRGLIAIEPHSDLDAFTYNEDGSCKGFYYFKCGYRLAPMLPIHLVSGFLHDLERFALDGWWAADSSDHQQHSFDLWSELALNECLEFWVYQAEQHGLPAPTGDKTILMFRSLLEDYSVAQIYNFIWGTARDAAAYYCRGGISKRQAANSMVGKCRSRADKHRVEKWPVKPYGRNYQLPRSDLSHVLFDVFLRIGEDGFCSVPTKIFTAGNDDQSPREEVAAAATA